MRRPKRAGRFSGVGAAGQRGPKLGGWTRTNFMLEIGVMGLILLGMLIMILIMTRKES